MIEGGCFCKKVRYKISEPEIERGSAPQPYIVANCHCTMCRKISGAPFVTWIVAPKSAFQYTSGNPQELKSSDHGTRYFCADCGTPIACVLEHQPNDIDITTGSMDNPSEYPAIYAVHQETKLTWLNQTEASKRD